MVWAAYGYVAARGSGSPSTSRALACNVKRMVGARLIEMDETLARPAALATVPAAA